MSAFYKTYHMPDVPKNTQSVDPALKFKKKFTESEINTIARMRKLGGSWDECGAQIGRTGESCYKAMKNRTYRANKALQQTSQRPAAPKKAPETDRLRRTEIQIRALTATLALMAIVILLMAVKVI